MIIKTENFDRIFKDKIYQIAINTKNPPNLTGSYPIKKNGDIVTDIDLSSKVYYNDMLVDRIIQILDNIKSKDDFKFVFARAGVYFNLGWNIDAKGGCNYDPEKVEKWFNVLSEENVFKKEDKEDIKNKLFGEKINIRDLIAVEKILEPYMLINWKEEDIKQGYIFKYGIKYKFLDTIKKADKFTLKFIYKVSQPNVEFCSVDYSLIDPQYKKEYTRNEYYTDNYYLILKSFKWNIKEEYFPDFLVAIKNLEKVSSLLSRIYILIAIDDNLKENKKKFKLNERNILENNVNEELKLLGIHLNYNSQNLNRIKVILRDILNIHSKEAINYFVDKLKDDKRDEYIILTERANLSRESVSKDLIKKRLNKGIKCPFFNIDIEEYRILYNLSKRILININELIDCFIKISESTNKNIKETVNETINENNNFITIKDSKIYFNDKEEYKKEDFKKLQIYIMTGVKLN